MTPRSPESGSSTDILLVEDNSGDARLVKEGCEEARVDAELHVTSDGAEALDFLRRRGEHADAPRANLVILDWTLPGMSGEEVLGEIKSDADVGPVPVLVYSGSDSEHEIVTAYSHHANAYVPKPSGPDELVDTIRSIEDFWFSTATLPPSLEDEEGVPSG